MATHAPTPQNLQIISSRRVLPATSPPSDPVTVPLSIADATTARFSICGAIWFYEASQATRDSAVLVTRLEHSLSQTLDDYRHFAGQLRWSGPEDASLLPGPQTLGRPLITYNAPTDPGVEFTHAFEARALNSLVPTREERMGSHKIWVASNFEQDELLPSCPLAFHPNPDVFDGLAGVSVQVTLFACGSWTVGLRMTHCLGDAVCLVAFVKAWAERARLLVAGTAGEGGGSGSGSIINNNNKSRCLFDPALLDRHAGLSARQLPEVDRIALARSLPMHRYDWWDADAPGIPAWARSEALATRPDAQTLAALQLSPATPPPWTTWDASATVEHVQIRITADEVRRLQEVAQADLPAGTFVSRLDALIAHLWVAVNRARRLQDRRDEEVFLNVSIGLRSRVSPPLPDTYAGSPLLLGHIGRTGADVCSSSLGSIALELREMMTRFTPQAVSAYLHDAAHEISPQRIWQAFLGSRQTGVTSWTKAGVYEVDFEAGKLRYVQARMPRLDGQLQIMDVGETGDHEVSLCLEKKAMARLLDDQRFWAWGADI